MDTKMLFFDFFEMAIDSMSHFWPYKAKKEHFDAFTPRWLSEISLFLGGRGVSPQKLTQHNFDIMAEPKGPASESSCWLCLRAEAQDPWCQCSGHWPHPSMILSCLWNVPKTSKFEIITKPWLLVLNRSIKLS